MNLMGRDKLLGLTQECHLKGCFEAVQTEAHDHLRLLSAFVLDVIENGSHLMTQIE